MDERASDSIWVEIPVNSMEVQTPAQIKIADPAALALVASRAFSLFSLSCRLSNNLSICSRLWPFVSGIRMHTITARTVEKP